MDLKYKEQIEALGGIDFNKNIERDCVGYRFTHEDISHKHNFLPVAVLNPTRITPASMWGISLFDTKEQGIERLLQLGRDKPNLIKKLGGHISEGNIIKTHGVSEDSDIHGHFNLFEYVDVSLKESFSTPEKIEL